tara:strand:- start:18 stop:446 length:429 start_codon:yes stop_codon:yes gene_type:complete
MIKITPNSKSTYAICEKYLFQIGREVLEIPAGYTSDGASVPKLFWKVVGTPFAPNFIEAAFVHDFLVDQNYDDVLADKMFFDMLVYAGVNKYKAKAMYIAVRSYRKYLSNKRLVNSVLGFSLLVALLSGTVTLDTLIKFLLW